jgi:hypothetical protein
MAEILVVAEDRPVDDSAGRWYRGMPVTVRPDGWEWGKKEGLPLFWIVKLPRVTVEEAKELLLEIDEEDALDPDDGAVIGRSLYARRKNVFNDENVAALMASVDGVLELRTVRIAQVRARLKLFDRDPVKRPPHFEPNEVGRERAEWRQ